MVVGAARSPSIRVSCAARAATTSRSTATLGSFSALSAYLDRLARPRAFSWRDDDAGPDHPHLARLLELAERHAVPLALAVIPEQLCEAAARRIEGCPSASVLQHGISHCNHAAPGMRKIELGGRVPFGVLKTGLRGGHARLAVRFGARARPVLVPPWNRIDPALIPALTPLGYRGLSTFGPADPFVARCGLIPCNVHVDSIDWRAGRRFIGTDAWVARIVTACEQLPPDRPLGLMSHHQVMGEEEFAAWSELLACLNRHANAVWQGIGAEADQHTIVAA